MALALEDRVDALLSEVERSLHRALPHEGELFVGVDLGTAYVVLSVVDERGRPVATSYRFAQVVKDGVLVDFSGAVRILRDLKEELEGRVGLELRRASVSFPPGTGPYVERSHRYAAEAAGFEVVGALDEPTAANLVLRILDGAIVDVGGGTTGIAVVKGGEVVYTADEPTGGTHFSLVIAGAKRISFEEAEEFKKDPRNAREVMALVKPVIQKVSSIVSSHIRGFEVDCLYLVGGSCALPGMEEVVSREVGLPTFKPKNPLFVTPLGIALSCLKGG